MSRDLRPDVIYWSHSYLAAWAPPEMRVDACSGRVHGRRGSAPADPRGLGTRAAKGGPQDGGVKGLSLGAARGRAADVCVALSTQDQRVLLDWGATVVLAPNGVDVMPYKASPVDGYALAMASYDYEPNVTATRRLVRDVWPIVTAQLPARSSWWPGAEARRLEESSRR